MFLVEETLEGGYAARALGESIFTEADDPAGLRKNVREAVRCHFPDQRNRPKTVRLHRVDDEILPT